MNNPLWFCCCCCFCSCCFDNFLLPDFDDVVLVSTARNPDGSTCIIFGEKCTTFAIGLVTAGDCSFTDDEVTRLGDVGLTTMLGLNEDDDEGGVRRVVDVFGMTEVSVDTTSILMSSSS